MRKPPEYSLPGAAPAALTVDGSQGKGADVVILVMGTTLLRKMYHKLFAAGRVAPVFSAIQ